MIRPKKTSARSWPIITPAITPRFVALLHSTNIVGTSSTPIASTAAEMVALLIQTRSAKSCAGFSE